MSTHLSHLYHFFFFVTVFARDIQVGERTIQRTNILLKSRIYVAPTNNKIPSRSKVIANIRYNFFDLICLFLLGSLYYNQQSSQLIFPYKMNRPHIRKVISIIIISFIIICLSYMKNEDL